MLRKGNKINLNLVHNALWQNRRKEVDQAGFGNYSDDKMISNAEVK